MSYAIRLKEAEPGDYIQEYDDTVMDIFVDVIGLWIEWGSNECGYVTDREANGIVHAYNDFVESWPNNGPQ